MEMMKRWHNKFINQREFREDDLFLLFNSWLKLFFGKLYSQLSGPFKVVIVHPYGAIKIGTNAIGLGEGLDAQALRRA